MSDLVVVGCAILVAVYVLIATLVAARLILNLLADKKGTR